MSLKDNDRSKDDRGDDEEQQAKRALCSGLLFWEVCGRKSCRRSRACAGDAEHCFARIWPHVPEETKVRVRVGILARRDGLPMDEVTRRMDEAVARFRAGQGDTAASHPQL